MTKTSTKGGLLTRALSCGCAAALAASLAPAAGIAWAAAGGVLPGVPATKITVNVGTFNEAGTSFTPFAQKVVAADSEAMQAKYQDKAVLFKNGSWNVAATSRFLSLTDILEEAGLGEYWTEDAKLLYGAQNYTEGTPAAVSESKFKDYADFQGKYFFPEAKADSKSGTSPTDGMSAVETGIALDAYTAVINTDVYTASGVSSASDTAGGTAGLMYEGFGNNVEPTGTPIKDGGNIIPTYLTGLTASDYQAGRNCAQNNVLSSTAVTTVNIAVPEPTVVSRIYGTDWADTMVEALDATFSGTGTNVVLTTSETFQDALAASGLAGAIGCPIVMTDGDELTKQAGDYMQKYLDNAASPCNIYVIGGEVAIKPAVLDQIKQLGGFYGKSDLNVERIAGDEAWDTSLEVRKAMVTAVADNPYGIDPTKFSAKAGNGDVVIACSGGYQDAMSIAPYAYNTGTPIILTDSSNKLSDDAVDELIGVDATGRLDAGSYVNIIGGPAVVSDKVESQLVGAENVYRTYGQSAYDTSNQVATHLYAASNSDRFINNDFQGATVSCLATGENYLDALASAAYCGTKNGGGTGYASTLLLVSNSDATTIDGFLTDNAAINNGTIEAAKIFGGEGVLGKAVAMDANQALVKAAK